MQLLAQEYFIEYGNDVLKIPRSVTRHGSDVGMYVRKSISNYFEGEHFH
jgi:hypothetical protein